jgi:hypothetical protein
MIKKPTFWPEASAVFDVPKTLVMARDTEARKRIGANALVVSTPLDLIRELEFQGTAVSSIVLTGPFARDPELSAFLYDHYPAIDVTVEDPAVEAETEWRRHAALTLVA